MACSRGYRGILLFYFVDGGLTFGGCAAAKKNVIAGGGTAETRQFKTQACIGAGNENYLTI